MFEELNQDLFKGTLEPVKAVLEDAKLEKDEIDEVVLVGGSSRIPKVQSLLKDFFNGKEPNRGINPDEAVAYGAAVQGGVLAGDVSGEKVLLVDVIPLSLGIETVGGVFLKVIPRNSIIPASKKQSLTTTQDYQKEIMFQVYEGERAMTKDNRLLGQFELKGIKVAPRGVPQVEVQMDVDENGILNCKAKDQDTGATGDVEIKNDKSRLTQEEIDRMVEEAKQYEEDDKILSEKTKSKVDLQQYVDVAKSADLKEFFGEDDKGTVEEAAKDMTTWLDEEGEDAGKEEFAEKLTEMKGKIDSIMNDAKSKRDAKKKAEEEEKEKKEKGDDKGDKGGDDDGDDEGD